MKAETELFTTYQLALSRIFDQRNIANTRQSMNVRFREKPQKLQLTVVSAKGARQVWERIEPYIYYIYGKWLLTSAPDWS